MGTGGRISANSVEYMETACKINEDKVIYPFAFRTHTHALGKYIVTELVEMENFNKRQIA